MTAKPKVLIVDDEERFRKTMCKLLTIEGIEAVTAGSASEAIEIMGSGGFDIAILDVRMPEVNGVQLLSALKKMDPSIEVIMMTGYASVDTAKEIMKLGAYDYLLKPYEKQELMDRIEAAYDRKLAHKKLQQ